MNASHVACVTQVMYFSLDFGFFHSLLHYSYKNVPVGLLGPKAL